MLSVEWWSHVLIWGSVAALSAGAILISVILLAPYTFFSDYPEDIQQAARSASPRDRRHSLIGGIVVLLVLLSSILAVVLSWRIAHPDGGLFESVLTTFAAVMLFVIVDIVIVDWLFICALRPKRIVLSGSEDCEGWRDYKFHVSAQFGVRGTSVLIIMSVVVGAAAWLLT